MNGQKRRYAMWFKMIFFKINELKPNYGVQEW